MIGSPSERFPDEALAATIKNAERPADELTLGNQAEVPAVQSEREMLRNLMRVTSRRGV
jgi:hypothetical protein